MYIWIMEPTCRSYLMETPTKVITICDDILSDALVAVVNGVSSSKLKSLTTLVGQPFFTLGGTLLPDDAGVEVAPKTQAFTPHLGLDVARPRSALLYRRDPTPKSWKAACKSSPGWPMQSVISLQGQEPGQVTFNDNPLARYLRLQCSLAAGLWLHQRDRAFVKSVDKSILPLF